jgi:hypothetical protein
VDVYFNLKERKNMEIIKVEHNEQIAEPVIKACGLYVLTLGLVGFIAFCFA